jgi:transcriptional regulator with XRE-family HTH domain
MSDDAPAASLNSALAATLNGERVRANLTFDALASQSGISTRTLMRLLSTNERDIDVRVLEILAGVFRTKASRLVLDAEEFQHRGEKPEAVPKRAPNRRKPAS